MSSSELVRLSYYGFTAASLAVMSREKSRALFGSIKAMVERLTQAGVTIVRQPTEVANLKLTYALVRDPDGWLIEFIQTQP